MAFIIYEFDNTSVDNSLFFRIEDDGGRLTVVIGNDDDEYWACMDTVDVTQLIEALEPYRG